MINMDANGKFETLITGAINASEIDLPADIAHPLTVHYGLLRKWNSTFNLTSLEKTEDIVDRLYIDSLLFLKNPMFHVKHLLDIGTGPGFPGIPMLLGIPDGELIVAEPRRKMCAFLSEVQYAIQPRLNMEIVNKHCDDREFVAEYRHSFPLIVSKAFAPPEIALKSVNILLADDGFYATCINDGTPLDASIHAGYTVANDKTYRLPLTGKTTRHIVFQKKN
jgi:16S rRNA (guanine(527)-N(7))-methyltransferase RsmG